MSGVQIYYVTVQHINQYAMEGMHTIFRNYMINSSAQPHASLSVILSWI